MKYILVHDLGTSGNKATLFDVEGNLIASEIVAYDILPSKNILHAEQNPEDWWQAVVASTKKLIETVNANEILAVSFSGHMHGMVCLDGYGDPVCNSMIWMDRRAEDQNKELIEKISLERIYNITGHRSNPMYTLNKLMWVKDNLPDAYKRIDKVVNTKDYITFKLTGNLVTDFSDASGTNMLDIRGKVWSDEMLEAAGINKSILPDIFKSTDIVGKVTSEAANMTGLIKGTPVVCGGGDGACATVGAGSIKDNDTYCCMGTSAWIASTSSEPLMDKEMTLFNFIHLDYEKYMPCGTMVSCGSSYDWAVKNIYLNNAKRDVSVQDHEIVEKMMESSSVGSGGLVFLPYLNGERSPRWNGNARGTFVGLTSNHNTSDMLRSVVEGVSLNLDAILKCFQSSMDISGINIIGGSLNDFWKQVLCDVFGIEVNGVRNSRHATSIGAAVAAGIGVGAYNGFGESDKFIRVLGESRPNIKNSIRYNAIKPIYAKTYKSLTSVFDDIVEFQVRD